MDLSSPLPADVTQFKRLLSANKDQKKKIQKDGNMYELNNFDT